MNKFTLLILMACSSCGAAIANLDVIGTVTIRDTGASNLIWFADGAGKGLDYLPVGFGQLAVRPSQLEVYNEPRSNVITRFNSVNLNGDGNQINHYMMAYSENIESGWQNYLGLTQTEYHQTWNSPYTPWGTNFGWRFFGINFVFDTATREFRGADGGFALDVFKIENPRQAGNPAPAWSVATTPSKPHAVQTVYGSIYAKPVPGFSQGGIESWGGGFSARSSAGDSAVSLYYYGDNTGNLGLDAGAAGKPFNLYGASTWIVKTNGGGKFIVQGDAGVGGRLFVTNSVVHGTNSFTGSVDVAPANTTVVVGWIPITNAGVRYYQPLYQ